MPSVVALSCPVCGAPLKMGHDNCDFCGSLIVIKADHPRINPHNLNRAVITEHIAEFRNTLRTDPRSANAHYGLGVAYFNLGLLEEALDELTQAAQLMPENPHIHTQLAVVLLDLHGRENNMGIEAANRRIERALKLDPTNIEANILKAEGLSRKQSYLNAFHALAPVVDEDPERIRPLLVANLKSLYANCLTRQDWDRARWCWTEMESLDSSEARQMVQLFLNRHRDQLPRKWQTGKVATTQRGAKTALLATLVFLGLAIFMIVMVLPVDAIMPKEDGEIVGIGILIAFVYVILLLVVPIGGTVLFVKRMRHRGRATPQQAFTRESLLDGGVPLDQLQEVAQQVIAQLRGAR